jgi:hypothetical protein
MARVTLRTLRRRAERGDEAAARVYCAVAAVVGEQLLQRTREQASATDLEWWEHSAERAQRLWQYEFGEQLRIYAGWEVYRRWNHDRGECMGVGICDHCEPLWWQERGPAVDWDDEDEEPGETNYQDLLSRIDAVLYAAGEAVGWR